MTSNRIDEALKRLEDCLKFVGQLEPLTPGLDDAIEELATTRRGLQRD